MANCETCKNNEEIPQQSKDELAFAFSERMVKRLWITILVLIFILVGTNAAWLYYESQWGTVYQEVTQEADTGTNNFVGGDVIGETDHQNP